MTTKHWSFPRAEALPTYAFVATDAVKNRAIAAGAQLIDLGLGNPDRPTPQVIVDQLHAAADVGKNHRYHPGRGLPALRKAIVSWYHRRHHVSFDVDREVVVTMGAKEGISHLCMAILDRGDTAVVPDPCYPIHKGAPMIAGATVAPFEVRADLEPAKAVADALARVNAAGGSTKLVIANYPQNPTGQVVTKEQLRALVEVVRDSGALLLHDLAYADLDFSSRYAPSIFDCGIDASEVRKFAVEVFSMSKSYNMPGWRIAFMVGNERMIGALAHLKTYMDYGTFMPLQHAAAWALDNGDGLVEEIRELYKGRATALVKGLSECGWGDVPEPSGTMFVWTKLPKALTGLTSVEATHRLIEEAHVAVAPGTGFGEGGEGFVRFALIEDPPRIAEACARIGKMLKA
ncbi:MAG: aminotransferase class I/II-fold pyridoxal phosphate-dependent enzyme [Myxococcales bacterium]|nr:aminotransferase class I/II-fold pyridoxal phosphate-dependent enzyme [Myxococcales bacterium]MCB9575852.1 aminotransferase class I/II-fold pyridoxal phosphate-dependent enzyme [Polyangiaceae bacterium]